MVSCWVKRSKVKGQRSKVKGQRSKVKGQRSKVKGQRSKVKGQRSKIIAHALSHATFNIANLEFIKLESSSLKEASCSKE